MSGNESQARRIAQSNDLSCMASTPSISITQPVIDLMHFKRSSSIRSEYHRQPPASTDSRLPQPAIVRFPDPDSPSIHSPTGCTWPVCSIFDSGQKAESQPAHIHMQVNSPGDAAEHRMPPCLQVCPRQPTENHSPWTISCERRAWHNHSTCRNGRVPLVYTLPSGLSGPAMTRISTCLGGCSCSLFRRHCRGHASLIDRVAAR